MTKKDDKKCKSCVGRILYWGTIIFIILVAIAAFLPSDEAYYQELFSEKSDSVSPANAGTSPNQTPLSQ